ncbi:DNA/RNA non-specific endonuclease [Treponema sp.]|uniref:DNA/RNA non-specific endonuclease n=1 Tax=Treponema sp. TaxID=166 RepID=UPI0025CF0488|nr:DNA/RNA non-specific endonuclease [Treponema sp.]MCR5218133.1 DNA/RNA non-specific endonuclease [Treponema sp.]
MKKSVNQKVFLFFSLSLIFITGFYSCSQNSPDSKKQNTETGQEENTALYMGNPSSAEQNPAQEDNYLVIKNTFALSYNNSTRNPNWVSWHLCSSDMGSSGRSDADSFHEEENIPDTFNKNTASSYKGSGYDRGHMCPSADRTSDSDTNYETFTMANMLPQTNQNNGGTWASLESYCRNLASDGKELYIIAGPLGCGAQNRYGTYRETWNQITIPAYTWKVILILDEGQNDLSRVTATTRSIAVKIPNSPSCLDDTWDNYRVSIDSLEEECGLDFFSAIPDDIENIIEAAIDDKDIDSNDLYSVYYPMPVKFYINGSEVTDCAEITGETEITLVTYPQNNWVRIYYSLEEFALSSDSYSYIPDLIEEQIEAGLDIKTASNGDTITIDSAASLWALSGYDKSSSYTQITSLALTLAE